MFRLSEEGDTREDAHRNTVTTNTNPVIFTRFPYSSRPSLVARIVTSRVGCLNGLGGRGSGIRSRGRRYSVYDHTAQARRPPISVSAPRTAASATIPIGSEISLYRRGPRTERQNHQPEERQAQDDRPGGDETLAEVVGPVAVETEQRLILRRFVFRSQRRLLSGGARADGLEHHQESEETTETRPPERCQRRLALEKRPTRRVGVDVRGGRRVGFVRFDGRLRVAPGGETGWCVRGTPARSCARCRRTGRCARR